MNRRSEYDNWHQDMANIEQSFVEEPKHSWHLTVLKLLCELESRRVLEIGCGRGDFAIWLSQKYPQTELVAVDFSETAITIARQKAATLGHSVNFLVADAECLQFNDQSFDYVISCECLEHILHPSQMVREIYRVLKPGGRFILTTENYFNGLILSWIQSWLTGKPFNSGSGVQPHENFFLFWQVKKMLEDSGLQVTHMESNHYQWLLLPRVAPQRLVTENFKSPFLNKLSRPFGRHFTFYGSRP